jgi:hypothetical protein
MCSTTTISRIEHLRHHRPGQGHRSTSSFGAALAVHTEDPPGDHPYVVATRLDPHTPTNAQCRLQPTSFGPIIALRPRELPLTPGTKRQVQTHGPPVIRRQIPTKCGFSPFRMRSRAHQDHRNAYLTCTVSKWSRLGSNQRPSACEADALPLSHGTGAERRTTSKSSTRRTLLNATCVSRGRAIAWTRPMPRDLCGPAYVDYRRPSHRATISSVARGCSAVGSASPCQGEGRGFESRHPLEGASGINPSGGVAEW